MRPHRSSVPVFLMISAASGIFLQKWMLDADVHIYNIHLLVFSVLIVRWFFVSYLAKSQVRRKLTFVLWFLGCSLITGLSFLNAEQAQRRVDSRIIHTCLHSHAQVLVIHSKPKYAQSDLLRAQLLGGNTIDPGSPLQTLYVDLKLDEGISLNPGDTIARIGALHSIGGPVNPGEFNYAEYMKNKHVYFRGALHADDFRVLSAGSGNWQTMIFRWRIKLLKRLDYVTRQNEDAALLHTLLLGEKSSMSAEVKSAFRNSGASHLLAVSGMHVGLVYALLFILVGRLRVLGIPKRYLRLSLLPLIWVYAFLTGFGPSVIRAVFLITLLEVVRLTGRKVRPGNVLFICIFILLFAQPTLLFDLGFQLSDLATIGIIVFALPVLRSMNRIAKWIRFPLQLCVVSIEAQVMVAPLVIYHFNQFQWHFLLTNLVLTPIVTMVMYIGSALLVFGSFPFMGNMLSKALTYLRKVLEWSTENFAAMDAFVVTNIPFRQDWVFASLGFVLTSVVLVELFTGRQLMLKCLNWIIFEMVFMSLVEREVKHKPELLCFKTHQGQLDLLSIGAEVLWLEGDVSDEQQFVESTSAHWLQQGRIPEDVYDRLKFGLFVKTEKEEP